MLYILCELNDFMSISHEKNMNKNNLMFNFYDQYCR